MTLSDLSNPYLTDPGGHEHYLTAEITEIGRAAQTHIGRLRQRQCDLSQ